MIARVAVRPAFLKVGLLLFLLNRRLKSLMVVAPEIHRSPDVLQLVMSALGKHYYQLANIRLVRPIRKRLERIMDFDAFGLSDKLG
jgi:hypothetical protein